MLNPVSCLNQLKTGLSKFLNITTFIASSNCTTPENFDTIAIIEIKGITQFSVTFSIKILIHKKLGHDACLDFSSKFISFIDQMNDYDISNFQTLPLVFNQNNKLFCQEFTLTLKNAEPKFDNTLNFNNETLQTQNTTLKIERQTLNLGTTIGDLNLIDFQKPVKIVEGSAAFKADKFEKLLQALNSKTVAPLTFKTQNFNATLMELSLSWNDLINFKFLEAQNEI